MTRYFCSTVCSSPNNLKLIESLWINDLDQFRLIRWCRRREFDASFENQDHADIRLINRLAIREVGSTGKFCAPVCAPVEISGDTVARPPQPDMVNLVTGT